LIGISVFLTLFGVKKVSLKRSDDADKKAEAKAWVEEKKQKKLDKKSHTNGHERSHGDAGGEEDKASSHETHVAGDGVPVRT
jgi:hypothetical protein